MKSTTAFSLFLASVLASPINNDARVIGPRQGAHGGGQGLYQMACQPGEDKAEYYDIKQGPPWPGAPVMKDGLGCISLEGETCEIAKEESVYQETTISFGGEMSANAGPAKAIWEAAGALNFQYGWTWGKGEAISPTVICPAGGIDCGLYYVPTLLTITGKKKIANPHEGCPNSEPVRDFTMVSPRMTGDSNSKAVASFKACVKGCEGTACARAKENKMDLCPGFTVEGY